MSPKYIFLDSIKSHIPLVHKRHSKLGRSGLHESNNSFDGNDDSYIKTREVRPIHNFDQVLLEHTACML